MVTEEEKKKEQPFRFRPTVAVAAACIFGALFAYLQFQLDAGWIFSAVFLVGAALTAIGFRKKKWVIVAAVLAVLVNSITAYQFASRTAETFYGAADVTGTVVSVGGTEDQKITLSNLEMNGIPTKGKLIVTVLRKESVREGDFVGFCAECESVDGRVGSYEMSLISQGVLYRAEAEELTEKQRGEPNFFGKIRLRIKESFLTVMSKDDAGIAVSLLLGDKEYLSGEDYDAVRASGTAHMFAISGLHVGFLIGAVLWILKKLKANRYVTFFTVAAVLFVYGFLSGFPASFNRACVMGLTMLFASLVMRRYDALTAIAAAATVILVFNPLSVFTAGFQMSFAAVLGITLLYRPIKTFVQKGLRFHALSSSVAVSVSSTLGIFPVTAAYFGTFSTYFIFSNLLVVPLVGITYLLLILAAIPAVIAPNALSFFCYPAYGFVRALAAVTTFFGSLPGSVFQVPSLGLGTIGYYSALAFGSSICVFRKKNKITAIFVSVLFALALFAVSAALSG